MSIEERPKYGRAISNYTKAIELDPRFVSVYYIWGNVFLEKEQYDRAISDFTKVLEIDPKHGSAYESCEYVYFLEQGAKTKACTDREKACELGRCRNYGYAKAKGHCK